MPNTRYPKNPSKALNETDAKALGVSIKSWAEMGFTSGEAYVVIFEPANLDTLIGYYATEALAKAAAAANTTSAGRPVVLANPEA